MKMVANIYGGTLNENIENPIEMHVFGEKVLNFNSYVDVNIQRKLLEFTMKYKINAFSLITNYGMQKNNESQFDLMVKVSD